MNCAGTRPLRRDAIRTFQLQLCRILLFPSFSLLSPHSPSLYRPVSRAGEGAEPPGLNGGADPVAASSEACAAPRASAFDSGTDGTFPARQRLRHALNISAAARGCRRGGSHGPLALVAMFRETKSRLLLVLSREHHKNEVVWGEELWQCGMILAGVV